MEKMGRGPNPAAEWLSEYITEGVEPQGVFIQLLDSKLKQSYVQPRRCQEQLGSGYD
jgi:hypothetical protein